MSKKVLDNYKILHFTRRLILTSLKNREMVQELIPNLFLSKEISEKTFKFLSKGVHRTSIFYMLPKIHKNKLPVPGRPIVSSCNSPIEKISMMLDLILLPCVLETNSYIWDTSDFLEKISNVELSSNDWIFTMDVTSLHVTCRGVRPHKSINSA